MRIVALSVEEWRNQALRIVPGQMDRKQTGSPQGLEVQREQEWLVSLHSDTDILKLNSGAACVIP